MEGRRSWPHECPGADPPARLVLLEARRRWRGGGRSRMSNVDDLQMIERRAAITGVGQSEIGRRLYRDPLELTLDGCLAAIEDAGLTAADIDGLSTYPGPMAVPPGFSGGGA